VSKYAKAVVAALLAVLQVALLAWQAHTGDGFQALDLIPVSTAVAGAVLTYLVPNVPQLPWAKAAVTTVIQILAALEVLYQNGPVGVNVTAVLVAVIGAVVVYQVPNASAVRPAGVHEA
jgi:hypothetical protein